MSSITDNCTILVGSCDINSDIWDSFFKIFKSCWGGYDIPKIVLNTESKKYIYNGLDIITYGSAQKNWGGRLREHLERIETPLVLFTLDDYYPTSPIDVEGIGKVCDLVLNDSAIDMCYIWPTGGKECLDSSKYPDYQMLKMNARDKLGAQAAVWKRERLIGIIKDYESPWQFERYGSIRARRKKALYYITKKCLYNYDPNGYGLIRGCWAHKTPELFEKYGIEMDFSIRGFSNIQEDYESGKIYSLRVGFPKNIVTRKFWHEIYTRFYCYIKSI